MFCAYSETLAFREAHRDLGQTTAPLHVMAERVHFAGVGSLIDLCAALSFRACSISCITAAGGVVLFMAHRSLLHFHFTRVHPANKTPGIAIIAVGLAAALGPIILFLRGATGFDVNGWMGSLATYGFTTAYLLVSVATPLHLKKEGHLSVRSLTIAFVAVISMGAAFVGSLYPIPPAPYPLLASLFFAYMLSGFFWSLRVHRLAGEPLFPA